MIGQSPAILTNPYFYWRKWPSSGNGFGLKGLAAFLPIDKKHTIVLFDRERLAFTNFGRMCTATVLDVRKLNLLQFYYTTNCVYFQNDFSFDNLKKLAMESDNFRGADIARVRSANLRGRKAISINAEAPDFSPSFDFFGFKTKFMNEPYGPTRWDLTRESIRGVLLRIEREKEGS